MIVGSEWRIVNLIFIGNKVHGDTMRRPLLITGRGIAVESVTSGGYATVGVIDSYSSTTPYVELVFDWIGER